MSAGPQIHRGPEWEAPWRDPAGGQDTVRGRSRLFPLGGPWTRLPWARLGAAARSWQEDLPSSPSPGDAAPARASHSEHHCSWKCRKRRLSGMTPQSGSHLPSLLSGAAGLAPTAECVPRSTDGRRKRRMNRVHLQEGPQLCFAVRFIPVGACPLGTEGSLGGRGPAQSRRAVGTTSCWEFQGAFCGMPGLAVHLCAQPRLGPSFSRKEACARPSSGLAAAPPLQGLPSGAVPLPDESGCSYHAHGHEQPGPCRGPGKGQDTGARDQQWKRNGRNA